MPYVCKPCRYMPKGHDHHNASCVKCGQLYDFVHHPVPRSRDDHKMWKVLEKVTNRSMRRRPRRLRRNNSMADWEKELLKAARR